MTLVVYAHPYPHRSRGCAALVTAVSDLPDVRVRGLYDLYPDFDIDVAAEQEALRAAARIVWLAPVYWYSVPALLKLWFERVLVSGFAHGPGGNALHGKDCLWAATTGGGDYQPQGPHAHPFRDFTPALEMTARYCGMRWLEPFLVHDPAGMSDEALRECAQSFRATLATPSMAS
jgi:glutathione-regulated potassium-efflux system ancillary protein KefF